MTQLSPKQSQILDIDRPMATLREAAGFRTYYAGGVARGVLPTTQGKSENSGPGIRLTTLIDAAKSFGGRLEIRFVREE